MRAREVLEAIRVVMAEEGYFEEIEAPILEDRPNGGCYVEVKFGILADDEMPRGTRWQFDKAPAIKILEDRDLDGALSRYEYNLEDGAYGYFEGFHYHFEPEYGCSIYHHTIKHNGIGLPWDPESGPTPLADAIQTLMWSYFKNRMEGSD